MSGQLADERGDLVPRFASDDLNSQSSTSFALKSSSAEVPFTVIVSLAVPGGVCVPPDLQCID